MKAFKLKYAKDLTEYKRIKQVVYRAKWKENKLKETIGRVKKEGSDSELSSEHNIVIHDQKK